MLSLFQLKNLGTDLCINSESKAENTRFGVTTCQLSNDLQVGWADGTHGQVVPPSPGGECEDSAFGSVCLSVCVRNSKSIAPIDLIFLSKKAYTRDSVLL